MSLVTYTARWQTNDVVKLKMPMRIRPVINIDFGDDDIIAAENITQEQIKECRAGLRVDKDVQEAEEALERYYKSVEESISLQEFMIKEAEMNEIERIAALIEAD